MNNFFKYGYVLLGVLLGSPGLYAQIIYSTGITGQGGCQLYAVDVQTCEYCAIGPAFCGSMLDLVVYPDGSYATFGVASTPPFPRGMIYTFTPPNFSMTITEGPVGTRFEGAVLAPNGLVYINGLYNGQSSLLLYDPVTHQIDLLGNLPAVFIEMYFMGGILYGVSSGPPFNIWEININDPMQSVLIQALPGGVVPNGNAAVGNLVYIGYSNALYEYNPATNDLDQICNFQGLINAFGITLSAPPPNGPPYVCSCATSAGTMQVNSLDFCVPQNASATHNNDHILDANDLLQFILYSDPADPTGSTIAISAMPDFAFVAPLQVGVTYYIAAIAGNELNGNVDSNDPCFSISDSVLVVWHPLPEVTLSANTTDVCAGGCRVIDVALTGTPPFTLTVSSPAGTATFTFSDNIGSFEICPPPGTPPGSFVVQATVLVDAFCTCP